MQVTTIEVSNSGRPIMPVPGSPLFDTLDSDAASVFWRLHGGQQRIRKDTPLIRARDPGAPLLTLISGWAFRYSTLPNGKRQIISINLPGDTIGADTLLSGAPVYPVQSATAVVYCAIRYEDAIRLVRQTDWFRRYALDALARGRAEAEAALARIGRLSGEQRVAAVLLDFYERLAARRLAVNHTFTLELTQEQLADVVALTPVHLNRVLNALRAKRLVSITGRDVALLNIPALQCLGMLPYAA